MPLKIIQNFDDPNHTRQTIYVPDNAESLAPRPEGTMFRDPITRRWRNRNEERAPAQFIVGLDLAQAADYTATAVVERTADGLEVVFLDRIKGESYPVIVAQVHGLMAQPELAGKALLVADSTGVGRAVVDLLRSAGLQPVALSITGGKRVTGHRRAPKVPKGDLINGLLLAFQSGSLRIAADLEHAPTLSRELAEMRRKLSINGNAQYGVWRDGEHDDLVLALAIAVWQADRKSLAAPAPAPADDPDDEEDMTGLRLIRRGDGTDL